MTVTILFCESVRMVHRPHHHLKVVIKPCPLLCFQNYSEKGISILRPTPHSPHKRARVLVGVDLPYLGRASHDSHPKDRDVKDVFRQEKSHHP